MVTEVINTDTLQQDLITKDDKLPLMESFYTIQGEGAYSGYPAYFIRLAGCDVGCVWCDVKESWNTEQYPALDAQDIANSASATSSDIAVITGGEPLMHNLQKLTACLRKQGMRTHMETSGVYPLSGQWDWICFSPKKFKPALPEIYSYVNELKVIIFNKSDFAFAEDYFNKLKAVNSSFRAFLQPEWDRSDKMLPQIITYVKRNPHWQISLQTHKYMQVP